MEPTLILLIGICVLLTLVLIKPNSLSQSFVNPPPRSSSIQHSQKNPYFMPPVNPPYNPPKNVPYGQTTFYDTSSPVGYGGGQAQYMRNAPTNPPYNPPQNVPYGQTK